MKDSTSLFF
jgi:hypothetical protein